MNIPTHEKLNHQNDFTARNSTHLDIEVLEKSDILVDDELLRKIIIDSLELQGFLIEDNKIVLPNFSSKEEIRNLHAVAVKHHCERSKKGLIRHENNLLSVIASGDEVDPKNIYPRLIEVKSGSKDELLFRYASLHWSIPVSSGYGRRLRFLILDEQNNKLIGLFGLGDPVFGLAPRDTWIGWDRDTRKKKLKHVMDAFVLGAVQPYSSLLCGKLIAMITTSNEVRESFRIKYKNRESIITGEKFDGQLALLTTTSALGRSSVYDRIKLNRRVLFNSVGFTSGSGEFHFSNGIYKKILDYSRTYCGPTAKHELWGNGFRNRREVVQKCLKKIGLSQDWLYHNIRREIFAIPLAENSKEYLKGEESNLEYYEQSIDELFGYFQQRWLIPRSQRDEGYKSWRPDQWAIWNTPKN